jgi:hypothetical protein
MRRHLPAPLSLTLAATSLLLAGCTTGNPDGRITNARTPGPVLGNTVGLAAGAVVGNAAGAVVGVGEGFASASAVPFNNDRQVVRTWQTQTTADGRTIQVPVEVEVDAYGRPIGQPVAR